MSDELKVGDRVRFRFIRFHGEVLVKDANRDRGTVIEIAPDKLSARVLIDSQRHNPMFNSQWFNVPWLLERRMTLPELAGELAADDERVRSQEPMVQ